MTRIFDALKKAASAGSPAAMSPRPAPVPPSPPPAYTTPAMRAPVLRTEPSWAACVPIAGGLQVPDDVVREMTTLRVAIESALPARGVRTLLFTSPQGREGTSTVALQFLEVLARDTQCRPVLLDANLRRPSLEFDGGARVARIAAHLRPTLPGDAAVLTPNAHALAPPDEARRLGVFPPAVLRELIEQVGESFDWIIVDGPPVLDSPDAAPLAGAVDGVVLVVEADRTKRPVLVRSADLLRNAGARILGSVLDRRRHVIPEFIYRRI